VTWGFLWLMVALKVPIAALLYLVWWAVRQEPEAAQDSGEGGARRRPHPHPRLPRPPRRGPHGEPALPSPPRVRPVVARARSLEH
jgi:hypothetical protein